MFQLRNSLAFLFLACCFAEGEPQSHRESQLGNSSSFSLRGFFEKHRRTLQEARKLTTSDKCATLFQKLPDDFHETVISNLSDSYIENFVRDYFESYSDVITQPASDTFVLAYVDEIVELVTESFATTLSEVRSDSKDVLEDNSDAYGIVIAYLDAYSDSFYEEFSDYQESDFENEFLVYFVSLLKDKMKSSYVLGYSDETVSSFADPILDNTIDILGDPFVEDFLDTVILKGADSIHCDSFNADNIGIAGIVLMFVGTSILLSLYSDGLNSSLLFYGLPLHSPCALHFPSPRRLLLLH